jgi:hypothetical protein
MIKLKCGGCKKAEGITVVCSMFGATSFALCDDCLKSGKENYRNMVEYIANAGHWPEDINDIYQAEVRRQLKLHGVPEEVFKLEVERAIAEEQAFIRELCAGKVDLADVLEGEF